MPWREPAPQPVSVLQYPALTRPTSTGGPTPVISSTYRRAINNLAVSPKTWVVTGAAGFIGSNLLEALLSLGQSVVGLDNYSTGHRSNIDEVLKGPQARTARLRMVEGDIRDLEVCRSVCDGADYVLHHAALGSVPWSVDDPVRTNSVNVDGFINMLVAARDAGVRRFVYASSSAVYGDTPAFPQVETSTGRPLSPYAASKSANEAYALAFERSYGLHAVGLRYFNVFGRRQDPAGAYAAVIPRWISALLRGEKCRIFGDGETTRDFCYIANVVQANLLAATAEGKATSGAYNVACGEAITLTNLFEFIRAGLAEYDPRFQNVTPEYDSFRAGDIKYSRASIQKAEADLGYCPTYTVKKGLSEALAWYVENMAAASRQQVPRRNVAAFYPQYQTYMTQVTP